MTNWSICIVRLYADEFGRVVCSASINLVVSTFTPCFLFHRFQENEVKAMFIITLRSSNSENGLRLCAISASSALACVAGPQFYGGPDLHVANQAPHKTEGLPHRLVRLDKRNGPSAAFMQRRIITPKLSFLFFKFVQTDHPCIKPSLTSGASRCSRWRHHVWYTCLFFSFPDLSVVSFWLAVTNDNYRVCVLWLTFWRFSL